MNKLSSKELNEKFFFNSVASKYDKNYGYDKSFTKYKIVKKIDYFYRSIADFISGSSNIKILEIGCGTGEYTAKLAKLFPKANIVGLDISKKVIEIAKNKCKDFPNVSFQVKSFYHSKLKTDSFDVICGFYSLHHMNEKKVLNEAYKLLKSGGLLYFCEPNILNPVVYLIKSNKYFKKLVGDSPDEWGVNPLSFAKNQKLFKILKVYLSEYIIPLKIISDSVLKSIDKKTRLLGNIPLIKYLGGSVEILLQKNEIDSLESRHSIEKKFHDNWATKIKISQINYKDSFLASTAIENQFVLSEFGQLRSKKILDLGCGMGDASLFFASQGADVCAVDISPKMISLVKNNANIKGYKKSIHSKTMTSEKLDYKNNYFDFVYGNGVLHHVDIELTLEEVKRVLKPNGKAIFIEPLGHNPVINVYRRIADKVRTPTEHPLDYSKLDKLSKASFNKTHHKEFHFLTLLIFLWFYFVEKVNPNQERYWKKIINDADKVSVVFKFLNKIDRFLLKIYPLVGKYYWNTVLVLTK